MLLPSIQKFNTWLTNYLQQPGDSKEVLLHKKIWWIINFAGFFILLLAILIVNDPQYGIDKNIADGIFLFAMPVALIGFHFYRRGIEEWALLSQITVVAICSFKVYLMGGLLVAGAPIFIGLIGPVYSLILPKKRRAIFVCIMYIVLMIGVTIIQPQQPKGLSVPLYVYGFAFGITQIFIVLFFFTTQVEKLKLREKKRMTELDDFKTKFYTNITHEFRTPLTIILGMAEQLAVGSKQQAAGSEQPADVSEQEALTMIKRNGQKLLNLTNQMLNLSKLEANVMPVNLVQGDVVTYLKYLVESFHSLAAAKKIRLAFSAKPEKIRMDFDPEKMQDIVSNLLSNAIKFTPEGGLVKVAVSSWQLAAGSRQPADCEPPAENCLLLTVKDTGAGISMEHLPQVFDRYFQADANGSLAEGTGLGLALTRELVKLLKGEITVESAPGKGSTFTARLPITNQAPITSEPPGHKHTASDFSSPLSPAGGSRGVDFAEKTTTFPPPTLPKQVRDRPSRGGQAPGAEKLVLLIVEDNADVLRYLRSLLTNDYDIVEAGNGLEGFEKAAAIVPDLVISDVMMPEMDGFAFCKKLKNDLRTSHIPVVLLTAKADAESRVEGLEAGADAYLAKPFDKDELFVRTKKLIELRQALQDRYAALLSNAETPAENDVFQKEDTFLQDMRRLLTAHLDDEEFGIAELCRSLGMSRSQLYRKFKALTDTTVHHFIRNLRLGKARELLLSSDLNVTEIAFETGFKNLSHFSKIFMEKFGDSPSQFRQKQHLDD